MDKDDLNIERLMDEVKAIGYNNVKCLFYCVPGVGVRNGGLRSLNDEKSLIEMLVHAERVKAIEIFVDHVIDKHAEVIMEDYDVLLLEGLCQPIDESITQPVDSSYYGPGQAQEAQEDVHAQQATTPKKKVTVATLRRSTPRKATTSANEKRTPRKATLKGR
ncbi:uncharacterized protein A4U43_UnF10830 [Asparagus officinalis]|uniref:PB1-like domain-containing protein n=1 Tax=Asparagus officinalis TaxID=4686 RepID=A0A1R3L5E8_ASPOF|nr:uncharacterized protein A4U43_UnF10830 [Asparagus officinalis]